MSVATSATVGRPRQTHAAGLRVVVATLLAACAPWAHSLELPEPAYDFGRVSDTHELLRSFSVTNSDAWEVEIVAVLPSCGCSKAWAEPRKLAAKAAGKVHVVVDPSALTGESDVTVTVKVREPAGVTDYTLHVYVDVRLPFTVSPKALVLAWDASSGTPPEGRFRVVQGEGAETAPQPKSVNVLPLLANGKVRPGTDNRTWEVSLTPSPGLPQGSHYAVCTIAFAGQQGLTWRGALTLKVGGPFVALPDAAVLTTQRPEGRECLVRVERRDRKPFAVTSVKSSVEWVQASSQGPDSKAASHTIRVRLSASESSEDFVAGPGGAFLTVFTDAVPCGALTLPLIVYTAKGRVACPSCP
ncbi:MAG: hypothetical protein COZ06_28840, partial [Armatimonadetes bacterium CG_4_10_14_3_um_filter_66_18]